MSELSNDDALWAYFIRVSQQTLLLDKEKVHDSMLTCLFDMGVHNW
jgi:hypothetical protein